MADERWRDENSKLNSRESVDCICPILEISTSSDSKQTSTDSSTSKRFNSCSASLYDGVREEQGDYTVDKINTECVQFKWNFSHDFYYKIFHEYINLIRKLFFIILLYPFVPAHTSLPSYSSQRKSNHHHIPTGFKHSLISSSWLLLLCWSCGWVSWVLNAEKYSF